MRRLPTPLPARDGFRSIRLLIAACAAAVATVAPHLHASTTATWTNVGSGSWTTATNWSTNPNFPNNGTPVGVTYAAVIDQPGTGAYTVTANAVINVDSLAINSVNATVSQTAGTMTVGALSVASGVYQLTAGTLSGGASGATVTLAGAADFKLLGGTLDELTFAGAGLTFSQSSGTLAITHGLDLSGNSLNLTGVNQRVTLGLSDQTLDHLTINGAASGLAPQLLVGGGGATGPVTLTLGAGATVAGGLTIVNSGLTTGQTLVNNGTLAANAAGRTLNVNTTNFTNNAMASATNGAILGILAGSWSNAATGTIIATGSTLTLGNSAGGAWSNAGTISASNASTINLGGSFTLAGLGTFNTAADTTINITGTLDNTGQTLSLDTTKGSWNLSGGTIKNGTFNSASNVVIKSGTFDGVTIASGTALTLGSSQVLTLAGAWSNQGSITAGSGAQLKLGGSFTSAALGGIDTSAGTLTLVGTLNQSPGETLTYNSTLGTWNVNGGAIAGGSVDCTSGPVVKLLNATLDGVHLIGAPTTSSLASLAIKDGLSGNGQTLSVFNSATVAFTGSNTLDDIMLSSGSVSGNTFTVNGGTVGAPVALTINANAGLNAVGSVILKDAIGSVSNLVNNGLIQNTATFNGAVAVQEDTFTNNGTVQVTSVGQVLVQTKATFTNNGAIAISGGMVSVSSPSWTNAVGGTISATNTGNSQPVLVLGANGTAGTNAGTITLDFSTLTLDGNWTNVGTITANNKSTVNLSGTFTPASIGTVNFAGATVQLTGTVNMTAGQTLTLNAATNSWTMTGGGTINGGTVTTTGGAALRVGGSATLSGVSFNQDLTVLSGGTASVTGVQMNGHAITTSGGTIVIPSTQTLDNLVLSTTGATLQIGGVNPPTPDVTLTWGQSAAINGGNSMTSLTILGANFVNEGVVTQGPGGIDVNCASFVNHNSIVGSNGGSFTFEAKTSFSNQGSMSVSGGGITVLGTTAVNSAAAQISGSAGALLKLGGGFTNNGTVSVNHATLTLLDNWTNAGVITATNQGTVNLGGSFTPSSIGTVTPSSDSNVNITGVFTMQPADVLTLNATTGSWTLNFGQIIGGTLNVTGGQTLNIAGGTLNGVHFTSGDLTGVGGATIFVTNGLTGDGHKLKVSNGVTFGGVASQTIDHLSVEGSFNFNVSGIDQNSPGSLTIGPDATVTGAHMYRFSPTDQVVNNGTLVGASLLTITQVTNNGLLTATSNEGVSVSSGTSLLNTGTFSVSGGTVANNGTLTNAGTMTVGGSSQLYGVIGNAGSLTIGGTVTGTMNLVNTGTASIGGSQFWNTGAGLTNNAGTTTLLSDAGSSNPFAVSVSGGSVLFKSTQHLQSLTASGTGRAGMSSSASALTPFVLNTGSLSITGGGAIDLSNNEMIATAPLAAVRGYIAAGSLITSALSGTLGSLDLGSGKVEVRFTLFGDTNLDGKVDVTDLGNLASSYGVSSGAVWVQGDTNYDGKVDVTDLGNLASNYGGSLAGGPSTAVQGDVLVASPTNAAAAVPEPSGLVGAVIAAGALLLQQRRKPTA